MLNSYSRLIIFKDQNKFIYDKNDIDDNEKSVNQFINYFASRDRIAALSLSGSVNLKDVMSIETLKTIVPNSSGLCFFQLLSKLIFFINQNLKC